MTSNPPLSAIKAIPLLDEPPTPTMSDKTCINILTLPTGILSQIADEVESTDLANLRLACKTFSAITTLPFGRRCLAHRRFVLTEHSLRELVVLTAHPVFGGCVRSVQLATFLPTKRLLRQPGSKIGFLIWNKQPNGQLLQRNLTNQAKFIASSKHIVLLIRALKT